MELERTAKISSVRSTEDLETRRRRREIYVRAACDLVNMTKNGGFSSKQFEEMLGERHVADITLYRHNDLVETFTAAARRHGVVFFLDARDVYYVDDLHARAWGLSLRPRNTKITAGSGRGLRQLLRKKGKYLISCYGMNTTAKRLHHNITTDLDVSRYNKQLLDRPNQLTIKTMNLTKTGGMCGARVEIARKARNSTFDQQRFNQQVHKMARGFVL